MKVIYILFCCINLIFASDINLKSTMPGYNLALLNIDGEKLSLNDIKGDKGTLVIFSSNTCPWVIRWEDRYVKLALKYTSQGIGMVAINSNSARFNESESLEKMKQHSKEKNYNFPYVQDKDSRLAKLFGATKTPHIYLFDSNDELVYKGAIDDNARNSNQVNESYLFNAIDEMLNGKTISKPISKALGCSIKFN
tara:strand:+ start:83 stop:667 length:585 start_codon:yes stop_codon:yes gene_type:complete